MRKFFCFTVTASLLTFASAAGADEINLSSTNSGTANGVIYQWIPQQSTGTGVIEPFLRIQGNGVEQGYNTSLNNPAWETKSGIWTHDLLFSALVTNSAYPDYYEFLLDINQNTGGPAGSTNQFVSLDQVLIYTRSTAIPAVTTTLSDLGTLRLNSDVGAQGNSFVTLDYDRNPGSGAGDMLMYVPKSAFSGVAPTDYVYFYSIFGGVYEGNDGFEEWSLRLPSTSVPDGGATALLLGLSMLGLGVVRRFRR